MRHRRARLAAALALAACGIGSTPDVVAAEPPPAEEVVAETLPREAILHHVKGRFPGDWFGWAVSGLDDADGDGVPDFAVGAVQNRNWGTRPAPNAAPGYVDVYSGRTGHLLYTLHGSGSKNIDGSDDHFGNAITSIADVDGDGVRELVVGAYLYDGGDQAPKSNDENTGGVFVFSGRTGRQLKRLPGLRWGDRLGWCLSTISDLDGDGKRDLIVGVEKGEAYGKDRVTGADRYVFNCGSIEILSTASFKPLRKVYGTGYNGHMGCAAAPVGDVNGDGVPDFAGGAFMFTHTGWPAGDRTPEKPRKISDGNPDQEKGRTAVFSGATGEELFAWEGDARRDHFGFSLTGLQLSESDGTAELAITANQSGWLGDFYGPGFVRIFSLRDGSLLDELRGERQGDQFGWWITNVGDRDHDGRADFLVGAPAAVTLHKEVMTNRPGRIYLFSGHDRRLLKIVEGRLPNDQFGISGADVGDLDGDGRNEILVGATENDLGQTRPGYAVVISGKYLVQPQG